MHKLTKATTDSANAMVGGAIVGSIVGFLFFTDAGRAFRRRVESSLEELGRELSSARRTMDQAASVVNDGSKLLNEVIGDAVRQPLRYPSVRQTSPF